jgi:hypothetical protein
MERNEFLSNFKLNKIFYFTFAIIYMTSCLFQISKICENYFSYETNTFVKYENKEKISSPAITVCIYKHLKDPFEKVF